MLLYFYQNKLKHQIKTTFELNLAAVTRGPALESFSKKNSKINKLFCKSNKDPFQQKKL